MGPRSQCYSSGVSRDDLLLAALRQRVTVRAGPRVDEFDRSGRPAAAEMDLVRTEAVLGFGLPPLLRRIYGEVAGGGFGPGNGLFPLHPDRSGAWPEEGLVEVHTRLVVESQQPSTLLPLCDWGCAIWSCLDCASSDGPIVTLSGEHPPVNTGHDLRSWLTAWLSGTNLWSEMFEPGRAITLTSPFTREPVEASTRGKPRGRPWP